MLVYNYAPETGEYLGTSEAHESPLEPGVYLVPACATTTAPPDAQTGCARCWNGSDWAQVEDHRGQTVYASDGTALTIATLGAIPGGCTATAPQADPNAAIDAQIVALEATQTLRRMRDAVTSDEGRAWLTSLEAQIAGLRAQRTPSEAA
jgi:hypothetical protein